MTKDQLTMIERVARAIVKRNFPGASARDIDEMWEGWRKDATAAINAMREPTDAMIEAGQAIDGTITAREVWQAMIDASQTKEPEQ